MSFCEPKRSVCVARAPPGPDKAKLILHFDANWTIMPGDPTGRLPAYPGGRDTLANSLNKIVCKNAYVVGSDGSMRDSIPTHWYDGSRINPFPMR